MSADDAPWAIRFESRAERDLGRLDPPVARRVIAALERVRERDPAVDVRRLRGSDEWRLRVGDWRVRLQLDFDARTVIVVRILPGDRTEFVLEKKQWERFVDILDRPARVKPGLLRLFSKRSVFSGRKPVTRRRRRQQQGKPAAQSVIRTEVMSVASDERDRDEMRVIREQLAELAPHRSTQSSSSA